MVGTLVNVGAVIVGSLVGLVVGARLPERLSKIAFQGIGLFSLAIGASMAIRTANWIVVVFSIVPGAIAGELIDIDRHLNRFGEWLRTRLRRGFGGSRGQGFQGEEANSDSHGGAEGLKPDGHCERSAAVSIPRSPRHCVPHDDRHADLLAPRGAALGGPSRFSEGMVAAFLLFCMGSMTVLGAIEEGLGRAPNLLLAKSVLDGFAAIALSATLGIGVAFSVIPLLVYQGGLTLFAGSLQGVLAEPVVNEISAVGGLLLIGLGINILEIKRLKILNMLPALVFAGVLAWLFVR